MSRAALTVTLLAAALLAGPAGVATAANLPESGTLELPDGADFTFAPETTGNGTGGSVAPAGDVNGDGRGDIIVGAPSATARGRTEAGSVYVVFGPREGLPDKLAQLGARGIKIDGAAAGDRLGTAVFPAGDVNGDGLADLALGAPRRDNLPGSAWLVLGRREPGAIDLAARGAGEMKLTFGGRSDHTGVTVGSAPDMDGDSRPELLVGADRVGVSPDDKPGPGAAFVVFAKALTGDIDLAKLGDKGIRLDGPPGGGAGLGLSGAPDMNGDGRGEILVGAPVLGATTGAEIEAKGAGRAYVVFGRATAGNVDLAGLGDGGITILATGADGFFGISPLALGDVTGDGVNDVAIGSPNADRNNRVDSGSVHVIAGQKTGGTIDLNQEGRPGFRIDGGAADDRLGAWNDVMPDVNDDKRPELLLAARNADAVSKTDAGAGYVVFGAEKPENIDLSGLRDRGYRIAGPAERAQLTAIASLGDFDGDSRGDLIVGAGGASTASIVLGPKPPPTPPPPPDPGVAEELASGCKAVTNLQVIVDDSLSMRRQDPQNLRRQAIELLVTKPRNEGRITGTYEFGSSGGQVFPPQAILPRGDASNQPRLIEALDSAINADNGGTDYNIAFKGGTDDNPAAQARIFITDGGHRGSPYLDGHRGGAPTFVIGLGPVSRQPAIRARLERIAKETGGEAFTGVTAEDVIRVVNTIDSKLNCDVDIDSDEDTLTLDDPVDEQVVPLRLNARTCDIDVSWGDEKENVEPEEIAFIREGRVVGRASRARLREVVRKPGRSYSIGGIRLKGAKRGGRFGLRISGMPANQLRVRYRVTKVAGTAAKVTSQITQSRRRAISQSRRRGAQR